MWTQKMFTIEILFLLFTLKLTVGDHDDRIYLNQKQWHSKKEYLENLIKSSRFFNNFDEMTRDINVIAAEDKVKAKQRIKQYKDFVHRFDSIIHDPLSQMLNDHKKIERLKICEYYRVPEFDYNKMAGSWQSVYFQTVSNITCFKMNIKETTFQEQKAYERLYGNMNGYVDWNLCNYEITSTQLKRKHFLLETGRNDIMANIVLTTEKKKGKYVVTLHKKAPAQWLVFNNLLLMRGCDTGEVIIFTRIPHQPTKEDIKEALMEFGDIHTDGQLMCSDENTEFYFKD